jgi:hypothetical protein
MTTAIKTCFKKTFGEELLSFHDIKRKYKMVVTDAVLAMQLAKANELLLIIMKKRAELLSNKYGLKSLQLPFESISHTPIFCKEKGMSKIL